MTIRNLIECDAGDCESEIITEDGETTRDIIDKSHALGWVTLKRADTMKNICTDCAQKFSI